MIRKYLAAAGALLLSACALQTPPPTLTFENVQRLNQANIAPLALGEFSRGPEISEARDRAISIRAVSVSAPAGGTFTAYLKQTIEAELTGAGKLAPGSAYILSAQMTRSEVSTGGAHSNGALGARFHLTYNGQTVYDDVVVVEEEWPSAFAGFEAVPDATNHYTGLYPKLFGALLDDPAFRAAFR